MKSNIDGTDNQEPREIEMPHHVSLFEQIRLEDEDGVEYWSARDLA